MSFQSFMIKSKRLENSYPLLYKYRTGKSRKTGKSRAQNDSVSLLADKERVVTLPLIVGHGVPGSLDPIEMTTGPQGEKHPFHHCPLILFLSERDGNGGASSRRTGYFYFAKKAALRTL